MKPKLVDAYAHVGYPRFGTPEELISVWTRSGIEMGNVVLPPEMPDFPALARARDLLGTGVRLFGIPYGPDPRARAGLVELLIQFGICGMRLAPDEILDNPDMLALLGQAGLCLMAINPHGDAVLTRTLLDWLERYPTGIIASPHFLRTAPIDGDGAGGAAVGDPGAFRELLRHPRMHAIFSRHGGASSAAYPHSDLRPWVDDVLPLLTWERVMWGSEIPVVFHRDEQVDDARDWLEALGITMTPAQKAAYLAGNATRVFFETPPPIATPVRLPDWVAQGLRDFIAKNGPVPVIRTDDLHLPLDLHGRLMSAYLERGRSDPTESFQQFLVGLLRDSL